MDILVFLLLITSPQQEPKVPVKALFIPLADHYPALVALERYGRSMEKANFSLEMMASWDLLRAKFQEGRADLAFVMCPLAIDMYQEKPQFRWVGLLHRDGNALAINHAINLYVQLDSGRHERLPDHKVADAFKTFHQELNRPIQIGVPHYYSTHAVAICQYLKRHQIETALNMNQEGVVTLFTLAPSKSVAFLNENNHRKTAAAFEQSLPWADIADTSRIGTLAWYSKDVLSWPNGHVECIILVSDQALRDKFDAVYEVVTTIQKSGNDIEKARAAGGDHLDEIVEIVRKHIPAHSPEAIKASLDPTLRVINYNQLNIDKAGLKYIMDLAIENGILQEPIDIDEFADERFINK